MKAVPAIVIHSGDDCTVGFEVRDAEGKVLATSMPFATICRLEETLATLANALQQDWKASARATGSVVTVGRRKVPLREPMSHAQVAAVINAAAAARIVDERPANRRRHDLSGLRCDLSH